MIDVVQRQGPKPDKTGRVVSDPHEKSKKINDLWDDSPINPSALEESAGPGADQPKKLEYFLPDHLVKYMYAFQVGVTIIAEILLVTAILAVVTRFGVLHFYPFFKNFDIFQPQDWNKLYAYYESGRVIPWTFVLCLLVPFTIWLYVSKKIIVLNKDPDLSHARYLFKPIAFPILLILNLLRRMVRVFTHPVRRIGMPGMASPGKKKHPSDPDSPYTPLPDDLDEHGDPAGSVTSDGGLGNMNTSYQSAPVDGAFVSQAKDAGNSRSLK